MCCLSEIQIQLGIWYLYLSPLAILLCSLLPLLSQTFTSACICLMCIYRDLETEMLAWAKFFSVELVIFTSTQTIRTGV